MMAGIGMLLIIAGAVVWAIALSLNIAAPGATTISFDLIATRLNAVLVGGFMIVSGCVLFAVTRLRDSIEGRRSMFSRTARGDSNTAAASRAAGYRMRPLD